MAQVGPRKWLSPWPLLTPRRSPKASVPICPCWTSPSSVPTPRCADIPSASRHTPTETNPPWSCGRPEVEDARPHGIAECPPDGHGQMQHRLAKAAERLARSLSLGAMNLDVEGSGQHKTVGVSLPCTPSHDGCNHDEGLQCPANPFPATVLACGLFDLFPDFRGEKLTHRARERLRTLGSPLCLFGRCPRAGSRTLCSHGTVLVSMGAWDRTAP